MNKGITVTARNVELIYSNRICCYDNDQLNIKIKLTDRREDELELEFLFRYHNIPKSKINIKDDSKNKIIIELTNFNNPLGTGLKKPIPIAKLNGRTISILFNVCKNSEANPIMDLSLYLENQK